MQYIFIAFGVVKCTMLEMSDSFYDELKKWKGKRTHRQAAKELGIPLWTFRGYWYARSKPVEICAKCLREIMNPK